MSRVKCHMSDFLFNLFAINFFGPNGEACWWRVCYQRGLPRLVYYKMTFIKTCLVVELDEVEVQFHV